MHQLLLVMDGSQIIKTNQVFSATTTAKKFMEVTALSVGRNARQVSETTELTVVNQKLMDVVLATPLNQGAQKQKVLLAKGTDSFGTQFARTAFTTLVAVFAHQIASSV